MKYRGSKDFRHDSESSIGLLLVNLGTPDAPTAKAVRRYLAEFLWDPRVIEYPRWLWWLVLHGVILRIRPPRSAKAYQKVWTDGGSPLLEISRRQASALKTELDTRLPQPVVVALGMRYGTPSIAEALETLRQSRVRRLLVLPLYPQYSATTTGSSFDAVAETLKTWRWLPELRFVTHYHDDEGYVDALAGGIQARWQQDGEPERLLFSFHGLPRRNLTAGDPYFCECHKTARLVTERLGLEKDRWALAFQSRVGREEWLRPYTDHLLKEWAESGVKSVDVICPGFSADCLETLEEIAMQNRDLFLGAGGETYRYLPALNDNPSHIKALTDLSLRHLQGWPEASQYWNRPVQETLARATRERAMAMGAAS